MDYGSRRLSALSTSLEVKKGFRKALFLGDNRYFQAKNLDTFSRMFNLADSRKISGD